RACADRALVDADLAVLALRAHAEIVMDDRHAHVDRVLRNRRQRAARTGLHAGEIVADDASLDVRVDERPLVEPGKLGTRELDRVDRTGLDALAARVAPIEEVVLAERARRSQHRLLGQVRSSDRAACARRIGARPRVVIESDSGALEPALDLVGERVRERPEKLPEAFREKPAAIEALLLPGTRSLRRIGLG